MKYRNLLTRIIPLLAVLLFAQAAAALAPGSVELTPQTVELGTFYGGAKMHLKGIASEGGKVIVVVRGPSADQVFNRLGRVGPIWGIVGKVRISAAPTLLLIFSSDPIDTCLNASAIDQNQLDPAALKKHMQIEALAPDRDRIAGDFLLFKARQGTYRAVSGGVQMGAPDQSGIPYHLDFEMPRSAAPGKYRVSVLNCRRGEISSQVDMDLGLVEVGFPAWVARLAKQQASIYGMISIAIAMLAGFAIDFAAARLLRRKAVAQDDLSQAAKNRRR